MDKTGTEDKPGTEQPPSRQDASVHEFVAGSCSVCPFNVCPNIPNGVIEWAPAAAPGVRVKINLNL